MDTAKGIAILLVIRGHTSIPDLLSRFIYSFHMPLFFIASGWMTNWIKCSLKDFCIKKIGSLVIPFICYSIIVLILFEFGVETYFFDWLSKGWQGYALWFIPVLFFSLLLVRTIRIIKEKYVRIFIYYDYPHVVRLYVLDLKSVL